jgi:hypothetical protein
LVICSPRKQGIFYNASEISTNVQDAREAEADVAVKQKRLDDGLQKLEDNKVRFGSSRCISFPRCVSDDQKKVVEYEAQIKELDKAIQGFNDNETPIKIKRESQRKKVAAIQKITAEMQVSHPHLERADPSGGYQEMRACHLVGCSRS